MENEKKPVKALIEKIAHECEEAGATKWDAVKIVKALSAEESAPEQKLREKALETLKKLNPEAAEVYASFNRMLVHTSRQTIEPFDRGNIVRSLLSETSASRGIAEKIGSEVEDQLKDLSISFLNTALIREMANVKLLEYGFEDFHSQYTRLGLPVADIAKAIDSGNIESKEILLEYNIQRIIPRQLVDRHFEADLHISGIEDFCTKPLALCLEPRDSIEEASALVPALLKKISEANRYSSLPATFNSANIAFSPIAKKSGKKKAAEAIALFNGSLAAIYNKDSLPAIGVSLFFPEGLNAFEGQRGQALDCANLFLGAQNSLLQTKVCLDSKFKLKALKKEFFENPLVFLNCSDSETKPLSAGLFAENSFGLLGLVGLNLEKLALHNKGDEKGFFSELSALVADAKKILQLKKSELHKRKYLLEAGIAIDSLKPALGVCCLSDAVQTLLDKKNLDRETVSSAEKIVESIQDSAGKETQLLEFPDADGKKRFKDYNEKRLHHRKPSEPLLAIKSKKLSCLTATAATRKELEELIDQGAKQIEFWPQTSPME